MELFLHGRDEECVVDRPGVTHERMRELSGMSSGCPPMLPVPRVAFPLEFGREHELAKQLRAVRQLNTAAAWKKVESVICEVRFSYRGEPVG